MRIAWRTAGAIIDRVWTQLRAEHGGSTGAALDGPARIGIDEISYRRGQLYLTVIVDHDNRVFVSRRLEGKVKLLAQPTAGI